MKTSNLHKTGLALSVTLSLFAGRGWAQATAESPIDSPPTDEETVVLSPFVVDATDGADTYRAMSTLAGTRVRTDLKDIASSISVITPKFLQDIGATNNQTLLQYTTNTEVGGIYGNFAGVGSTFVEGAGESAANLLRPASNTRVRGLDSADNTRDYVLTDIPWDGFNMGRVDMQRGPNSILFGVGSPAGIVNTSVNTAGYETAGRVEARFGSFGSRRGMIDYNQVLLDDELAVRVAAVHDHAKYRQQPSYNRDRRVFGAARWDPKLFGKDGSARTTVRVNYESGEVNANRPRSLPPIDRLTPFFDADKINKQYFDSSYADEADILSYRATLNSPANFWLSSDRGTSEWANPVLYYDNTATPTLARQGRANGQYGINTSGEVDHSIDAWGNYFPIGIATYGQWAKELNQYGSTNGQPASVLARVAGAQGGFYKSKSLIDPSIYDFYNNLLDGPTKREWQDWDTYNIALDQTFFHDRVGLQAMYDRQNYSDGQVSNLGWNTFLSVDIAENNLTFPGAYTDLATANPNAGRVYTGSSPGGSGRTSERENFRLTAFGELRASDYLDEGGLLSRILGRHLITGLYSEETYEKEDRNWARYAVTSEWSNVNGKGYVDGDRTAGLRGGDVTIATLTYLTPSVADRTSASGLNVPRIMVEQSPSGTLPITYFDSHWNRPLDPAHPDYVNPADPWDKPYILPPNDPTSTQSDNPANYVGWTQGTFTVLNSDRGDINSLYKDAAKFQRRTDSKGATWQAYLWDDTVVLTAGWRKDRVKQRAGFAPQDQTGLASMDYDLEPLQANGVAEGTNASWGIVLHTPRAWRDKLPWGTNISLGFMDGENIRVENRYGFDGNPLPNAVGNTQDYSVVVNTLNDRLTFRATYYKTQVFDANIASVTTATTTLGNATGTLRESEAWGTASAMMDLAGMAGDLPGWEWYWNWALIAGEPGTGANAWNNDYWNPVGTPEAQARFNAHPETIKQKAAIQSWQDQMLPQSWFDAFGYDIDVAKVKAGDYANAINSGDWQPNNGPGSVQTPGSGRINGEWPTGTVDYESKGWEFELVGEPLKNWSVSLNASKQHSAQTALGDSFTAFIETLHAKYESPAGDLRRWWGGDDTFRMIFNREVWAAYQFQNQTNGKLVPEMAPWRFNLVTNYAFDSGRLKGLNLGASYRWQDGVILGYALNEAQDNLDVDQPYWGPKKDWTDLWIGYERDLSEEVRWRIQLNLRSIGKSPGLEKISIQPDGTPAQYRIEEGATWTVTNTFSF